MFKKIEIIINDIININKYKKWLKIFLSVKLYLSLFKKNRRINIRQDRCEIAIKPIAILAPMNAVIKYK